MMISTLEGKVTDFPFTTFTTKKQYKLNKIKNDFIVSLVLNVTKIAIQSLLRENTSGQHKTSQYSIHQ